MSDRRPALPQVYGRDEGAAHVEGSTCRCPPSSSSRDQKGPRRHSSPSLQAGMGQ